MKSVVSALWGLCVVVALAGCAAQPASKPRVGPPLIDVSKGAGGMPLEGNNNPRNVDQLRQALVAGYEGRLTLAHSPDETVRVSGRDLSHLQLLVMDVSGARVKPGYRPRQLDGTPQVRRSVKVDRLEFTARPLVFETAQLHVAMQARDATMKLMTDRTGQSSLVMMGARSGVTELSVSRADLEQSFTAAAKKGAAAAGATLRWAEVSLHSDNPRSMNLRTRIHAHWMLIPLTFRVAGRIDIDDQFRARFSQLQCEGEDPLGALVASFIESRMKKAQERISPLMKFGDGRTEVRSFEVFTDDGLRMRIGFGH